MSPEGWLGIVLAELVCVCALATVRWAMCAIAKNHRETVASEAVQLYRLHATDYTKALRSTYRELGRRFG